MQHVKIQKRPKDTAITIPASMAENLKGDYMAVEQDERGRIIYTPLEI